MTLPGDGFFATAAIPLLALLGCYAAGAWRRRRAGRPVSATRHAAFAAGVLLLLLSVEAPFARWAHELFYVHQLGIFVARVAAPLLIALAHPAGTLVAGLPRLPRHRTLAPLLAARPVRSVWSVLRHPATIVALYLGSLVIWEIPAFQALAVSTAAVGLATHAAIFVIALLFWTSIVERRPAPHGVPFGERLMMIWIAMLGHIAIGAYLTVKTSILYPAYAAGERLMHLAPFVDEQRGGLLVWIPSALLFAGTLMVVIDQFGRHETRMDDKRKRWTPSNSAILLYPTTAAALRELAAPKNRKMRFGLTGFALAVFAMVWAATVTSHKLDAHDNIILYRESRF
jgi:putative membrane protein